MIHHLKKYNISCLVCSCEKTKDIANYMLLSLNKFSIPDSLQIYIGCDFTNMLPIKTNYINTPQSNWKNETIYQLEQIKIQSPGLKHILVLLDDFIFKSEINVNHILKLSELVEQNQIKYLMLKPSADCFINKLINKVKSRKLYDKTRIYRIRNNHPYFFSLQAAIWDIDYLIKCINDSTNIWNFENMKEKHEYHYAVTKSVLDYEHIVEKGEWDFNARNVCLKTVGFFNPGQRKFRSKFFSDLFIIQIKKISFFIFGYSIMLVKRKLKNI